MNGVAPPVIILLLVYKLSPKALVSKLLDPNILLTLVTLPVPSLFHTVVETLSIKSFSKSKAEVVYSLIITSGSLGKLDWFLPNIKTTFLASTSVNGSLNTKVYPLVSVVDKVEVLKDIVCTVEVNITLFITTG